MLYLALRYLHVFGAVVLFGTGIGIAFFMLMAHRSGDVSHIFRTARVVVLADFVFTATAIVVQPITGIALAHISGYALTEHWIVASVVLYLVAGAFWLPVVWMQRRMRDLAGDAVARNVPLPDDYHRLFRLWFWFGFPGFGSVALILWLMIARPIL